MLKYATKEQNKFRYIPRPDLSRRIVRIGGVEVGKSEPLMIAGPCTVEDEESFLRIAAVCKKAGAHALRGGAFKPRTSPYSFQGLGEAGLEIMAAARDLLRLPICTEVLDPRDVGLVARYADVLQIGARNMQNYALLKEVGQTALPVLLKRNPGATVSEWLHAAEYVLAGGNDQVILCERGIRTFEGSTRYTLDVAAVPEARPSCPRQTAVRGRGAAGALRWRRNAAEPTLLRTMATARQAPPFGASLRWRKGSGSTPPATIAPHALAPTPFPPPRWPGPQPPVRGWVKHL